MDAQIFRLRPLLKPAHPPFQFTAKPIYLKFNQFSKGASFSAYNSHYKKNNNLFAPRKSWSNQKLVVSCESNAENGDVGSRLSDDVIRRKKLVVFVSGGGSNFKSIHKAILEGRIHGDIVALVASKNDCGGAVYARDEGIPIILFPKTKSEKDGLFSNDLVTTLRKLNVDYILLAGFLKLIPAELIRAYPRSILNIHPSLLPAFGGKGFYGMKVHQAVIASGARFSGPTIHFMDEHYDTGRILAQRVVPVLASDTANDLAARVLHEEHKLYVEVTTMLCEGRIVWREDGVPLIQSQDGHMY